jgi:Cof subfamily protein (haloacid dehalogenase superfamily)
MNNSAGKIKAVFFDIDGTLLKKDHSLSPEVKEAVKKLKDSGVLPVLASGRSWEALKPLYKELDFEGPAICYNGAVIVEGISGKILFEKNMDEDVADAVTAKARSENREFVAYRHSDFIYESVGPEVTAYKKRVGLEGRVVNFDSFEKYEFTKMIVFGEHEELQEVKKYFEAQFPADKFSSVFSDLRFLEFVASGVDKGVCLKEVCRIYGIDPAESAALGDGWNDLSMLEAAGKAWVMGGADEKLKKLFPPSAAAPSAEEDGAAAVIEEILKVNSAQ